MNKNIESQSVPYVVELQDKMAQKPASAAAISYTPSDAEKKALTEASLAFEKWKASPEGQQKMAALDQMTIQDVSQMLTDLISGPVFAPTVAMLTPPNLPSIPDLGFGFKSFSIGLNFQAQLIVGFTGTIGVAIGFRDSSLGTATFLSLGLDEGVEAGAMAGVQFGFWKSAPNDLGGYTWGEEVIIDDEAGAAVGVYENADGSLSGVTLTLGAGVDDGGGVQESYTFILSDGNILPPIYQPDASHFLILTKLKCVNISGGDGDKNEVYFKFTPNGGATYPYPSWDYFSMAEGDIWNCGRSVKFNSSVYVEIYDTDDTSSDDLLVSGTINLSNLQVGVEKSFDWKSKNGLDEREYIMYAKLIY